MVAARGPGHGNALTTTIPGAFYTPWEDLTKTLTAQRVIVPWKERSHRWAQNNSYHVPVEERNKYQHLRLFY